MNINISLKQQDMQGFKLSSTIEIMQYSKGEKIITIKHKN